MSHEGVLQVDVSGRNLQASVSGEYCKLAHGGVLQADVSGELCKLSHERVLQVSVSGKIPPSWRVGIFPSRD